MVDKYCVALAKVYLTFSRAAPLYTHTMVSSGEGYFRSSASTAAPSTISRTITVDWGKNAFTPRQPPAHQDPAILAEASSQAMVAAGSILAAGGSEAVAMSSAKAAAETVLNERASGGFFGRRKHKREAEIVGSMAYMSVANSQRGGGAFSSVYSFNTPPKPPPIIHNNLSTKTPSTLGYSTKAGYEPSTLEKVLSGASTKKDSSEKVKEVDVAPIETRQDDEEEEQDEDHNSVTQYWKRKQSENTNGASPKKTLAFKERIQCIPNQHRSVDSYDDDGETMDDNTVYSADYTYDDATYDSQTMVNTVHINETACCNNPQLEEGLLNVISCFFCGYGSSANSDKEEAKSQNDGHNRMKSDEVITGIYKEGDQQVKDWNPVATGNRNNNDEVEESSILADPIIKDRSYVSPYNRSRSIGPAEVKRHLDEESPSHIQTGSTGVFWNAAPTIRSESARLLEQAVLQAISPANSAAVRSPKETTEDEESFDDLLDLASNPMSPNARKYPFGSRFQVRGIDKGGTTPATVGPEDHMNLTSPSRKRSFFGWKRRR